MSPELDDKLAAAFPNLYRDRHGNPRETLMCFGFDHSDGWFQILWDLSRGLEAIIMELPEEERPKYRAAQVKEKFGGLRFYMTATTHPMERLINIAEYASSKTCEACGKPGRTRGNGWVMTICDECERDKP